MQFYCKDFLASSAVQRMSLAAQGAYMRLLCYQWEDGFLPTDQDELAQLCQSNASAEPWPSIWKSISGCFCKNEFGLINARCNAEREKALEKGRIMRENAAKRGHTGDDSGSNEGEKPNNSRSKAEAKPKVLYPDSDSDIILTCENVKKGKRGDTARSGNDPKFDEFWSCYPKRKGSADKYRAQVKFAQASKSAAPDAIIAGAKQFCQASKMDETYGTPYVKMAATWLHNRCWEEYGDPEPYIPEVVIDLSESIRLADEKSQALLNAAIAKRAQ